MNTDQWIILSAFIFIVIILSYIIFVPSKKHTHKKPHPTPVPTPQPTPEPTPHPTPEPTPHPTPEPTPQPQSDTTPQQNQPQQSDTKPLARPRPNSIIKEEQVRVRTLPRKSFFSNR